uniref:Uncharacterized protein n=1 Tax=Ditylenchus dipsaci TaxID=166011 RepID=A0A915D318_9BILA
MQLLEEVDKKIDCTDSHVLNIERYKAVVWERRWMALATFSAVIGIVLFVFAVLSPDWTTIDFTNTNLQHVNVQLGVFGEWRSVNTSNRKPEWISHFPEPASHRFLRLAGVYLKHYYRAQAAFCIIGLVMMLFTNGLALYSFTYHRYMFKRLVAFLYLFTAMCVVLCIEILLSSVDEWNTEVAHKHQGEWEYSAGQKNGIAVYLARTVVVINLIAAAVFAFGSKKQKGNHAATAEFEIEDRPVHCSRR